MTTPIEIPRPAPGEEADLLAPLYAEMSRCERDGYSLLGHCLDVARVAEWLALATGEDPATAFAAGLLHDVGKVRVRPDVLFKPASLTPDEHEEMRSHPEVGAALLTHPRLATVAAAVRHHHERMDGRGYPHGLAGDAIPRLARLVAAADFFVAYLERRCYRDARPFPEVLDLCRRAALDGHLDPTFVRALVQIPESFVAPTGEAALPARGPR